MTEGLLQQLGELPGVVGSLFAGHDGRLQDSAFPAIFDPEGLQGLATTIARSQLPQWLTSEDDGVEVRYPDGRVLVRTTGDGLLLVLCTSQVDLQLLRLAMTQAVRRWRNLPVQLGDEDLDATGEADAAGGASPVAAMVEVLEAALGDGADGPVARLEGATPTRSGLLQALSELEPTVREAIGSDRAAHVQFLLRAIVESDLRA